MPARQTTTTTRTRKPAAAKTAAPAAPAAAGPRTDGVTTITRAERDRLVALAAYYAAERRGFAPGHELEDWLSAEAAIERELAALPAGAA